MADLAGAPGAFYEVQLIILLNKQLHHTTSHNVKLPGHIIHAVQVAVWTQIHLHTSWARCQGDQHLLKVTCSFGQTPLAEDASEPCEKGQEMLCLLV